MASKVKKTATRVGARNAAQATVMDIPDVTSVVPGIIPETDVASAASGQPSTREETIEGRRPKSASALFTESPEGSEEFFTQKLASNMNIDWTKVPKTPKRARSLDSAKISRDNDNNKFDELPTEPVTTGETAAIENVQQGTTVAKGKHIDPREWGDIEFNDEEIDVDAQEAAIKAYNKVLIRKNKKNKNKYNKKDSSESETKDNFIMPKTNRHLSVLKSGHATALPAERRAGSRPAAQIAPMSSLGVALTGIASRSKIQSRRIKKVRGDPSSPSSSDDSDESESTSGSNQPRRRGRKLKKYQRKLARKASFDENTIKPIPPKEYDGSADPSAYHRFVMEGEAYLRDGNVSSERQFRLLAHFLKGKSYDFYMQKVAPDDPENWDLHKFFTEMFNYCFPIDYRQQMRFKMEEMTQSPNQSVSEYVHDLQEIFSMVGALTAESKVIKLWYSLRASIQRTMWKDGLHPDTSTWDEIVAKAEVIEIAGKVIDPQDRRVRTSTFQPSRRSDVPILRNNTRNGSLHQNVSSQAVTFTPPARGGDNNNRNHVQNRDNGTHRNFDRRYTARGRVSNNN